MHHFPPYSRAGEQIKEKSMVFEPPAPARPRGAPSRTHTFQWFLRAPARPRSPPRRKKGHPPGRTRAYAFWSMSDHANPSYLPSAYTSRTPYKPIYNRCGAKKRARPPCKTLYLPSARRSDREAGRQTTKSRQTPPPPRTPQNVAKSLKIQPPEAPGGSAPAPSP